MKNLKLRKRGLSLIELVVALSLIAIILMIVSPFFISNYVTLDKTSNQIDFQREAKSIMNYFTESSMEASKISSIKIDNSKDSIDLTRNSTTVGLGKGDNISITFDNDELDNNIKTTFRLENEVLYYKKDNKEEFQIGQFVKDIEFNALPSGKNFNTANSIEVKIEFDTKNATPYEVSNILTFRNKNKRWVGGEIVD
ncbi:PilW family protein [Clostridium perfringens]|uniref:Prepilin-type N-terminal cleavage/methylation domain-containing protein n=2 Tax=Clostridium perfringens TaxID=1502 RepID=A0AAW9I0L2_CLOPF|nr:prepilin-type N-terminal cleavage/methylation domain-containing protein [Clostridium perfringens]MBI5988614.1 prepilin-type N-terminal cleavage/methylation domain-containing protein [Clostridium perfringens]MBI5994626.1 prepilin-type N-terminal cleavage/methylation domain-containing protein [Clostridium perfringens]MBI6058636.1 prepilin-type N-terminal cleavage/methylation domain-containing protein [Clostridium perfringens]MBI6071206.1 prepilin-type N-terminal cleavage/methylation domain-con